MMHRTNFLINNIFITEEYVIYIYVGNMWNEIRFKCVSQFDYGFHTTTIQEKYWYGEEKKMQRRSIEINYYVR